MLSLIAMAVLGATSSRGKVGAASTELREGRVQSNPTTWGRATSILRDGRLELEKLMPTIKNCKF